MDDIRNQDIKQNQRISASCFYMENISVKEVMGRHFSYLTFEII